MVPKTITVFAVISVYFVCAPYELILACAFGSPENVLFRNPSHGIFLGLFRRAVK